MQGSGTNVVEGAALSGRDSQRSRWSRPARILFIGFAFVAIVTVLPRVQSWSDASRMATVESLVDLHTFSIDHSQFADTGDKVFVGGHFYSDKLALPALLAAVVYLPLSLAGLKLSYGWNPAYYVITLLTVKISWLGGLLAFYQTLGMVNLGGRRRLWLTSALGIASLYFTWSSTFNNHALAASWIADGFYFVVRCRRGGHGRRSLFLSGLFFGLAAGSDLPLIAVYASFAVYVLCDQRLRKQVGWYLLPCLMTLGLDLLVNFRISGSIVPVQLVPGYFLYPGSPWYTEQLTGTTVNQGLSLAQYSFTCLLGSRGFLLYNPLLFIAIPLLVREIVARRPFASEAAAVALGTLPVLTYYLLFSHNYGGWSYSIRWFVPFLPLWYFFLYPALERRDVTSRAIFLSLAAISVVIASIGLLNPWSDMRRTSWPLVANAQLIVRLIEALVGRLR